MFKKTPIALAILALSATMSITQADTLDSSKRQIITLDSSTIHNGDAKSRFDLTGDQYFFATEIKGPGKPTLKITGTKPIIATSDEYGKVTQLVLSNFSKLNLEVVIKFVHGLFFSRFT